MVSITIPDRAVSVWLKPLLLLSIGLLLLSLIFYHDTLSSMVDIWRRSDTFAHGFLIAPISLFLIWQRRASLVRLKVQPDYRALVVVTLAGLTWLLARLAGALVVEQFALVGVIVAWVWAILGIEVVKDIAFPLGFLFFAVPFGEFLIPSLMSFTADFTVLLLQWTGIPVYREGNFFSIPSGDWSVVTECSGIRYLIASITLGFLYAYLSYRSLVKRAAFIALATAFPIIANGLRAYLIVMIGHLSDMKLAVGVDHLVYGWVFFGLVMLFLFWIGTLWREQHSEDTKPMLLAAGFGLPLIDTRKLGTVFLASLVLSVIWPLQAEYLVAHERIDTKESALIAPESLAIWRSSEPSTEWEPYYVGADARTARAYTDGVHHVTVHLIYYRGSRQGHELISSLNGLVPQHDPLWHGAGERLVTVTLSGKPRQVVETQLLSSRKNLLVWRWNWVAGFLTVNDYWAKALEAGNKFLGNSRGSAAILIATDYPARPEEVSPVLNNFAETMWPSIERSLIQADGGKP